MKKALLLVSMLLASSGLLNAQLVVSDGYAVDEMVNDFFSGSCVSVSNVSFTAPVDSAGVATMTNIGFFDGSASNVGVNAGLVLSSGNIEGAVGPNDTGSESGYLGLGGDMDLDGQITGYFTYDAAVLEMDLVSTEPTITFQYVFGSEEYLEWVNSSFNDVFAFFISGPGIDGVQNIALIPGTTTAVSINNLNDVLNAEYYINNGEGITGASDSTIIQYDGFTVPLTAVANVTPGETYHVKIAIADAGDAALDSGVFLSVESLCGDAASYLQPSFDFTVDGNTVTFNNTSLYGLQFEWDFGDGTTYIGANPPPHTYAGRSDATVYTITLTVKNAAGTVVETVKQDVTIGSTIGIASPTANGGLQVYPNPVTDGQLNVQLSELATVRLMDVTGRVLATQTGQQLHFELTAYGRGLYLLETTVDGQVQITKVMY